ncbi:MAG: type IV pilin-like G/H family protein [Cyanobacteria bacterium SID2]|nr:type IV pilin-like G/H family protein [Cyanobacteria bacterium SID2]MBP0006075.1 type IV pilin-like G/H family protein [Cyanobacteria bacterium SBC]
MANGCQMREIAYTEGQIRLDRAFNTTVSIHMFFKRAKTGTRRAAKRLSITAAIATVALTAGCSSGSKWAGTWEIQDPGTEDKLTIVLTEDGKAYVNSPLASEETPEYLELPITRVSDDAALPDNSKVVTLEEAISNSMEAALESEGQTYIGAMARGQQAYFLENNKFSESIDELQLGLQSETENYKYEIAAVEDKTAYLTASAKQPELQSFSVLVYVENTSDSPVARMLLCGTDEASQTAPDKPKVEEAGATCPSGSSPM